MVDFCYHAGSQEEAEQLADAMRAKHGCHTAAMKSARFENVFFVIPADNAPKWRIKYEKVYSTDRPA